jgi:hypothetical protein
VPLTHPEHVRPQSRSPFASWIPAAVSFQPRSFGPSSPGPRALLLRPRSPLQALPHGGEHELLDPQEIALVLHAQPQVVQPAASAAGLGDGSCGQRRSRPGQAPVEGPGPGKHHKPNHSRVRRTRPTAGGDCCALLVSSTALPRGHHNRQRGCCRRLRRAQRRASRRHITRRREHRKPWTAPASITRLASLSPSLRSRLSNPASNHVRHTGVNGNVRSRGIGKAGGGSPLVVSMACSAHLAPPLPTELLAPVNRVAGPLRRSATSPSGSTCTQRVMRRTGHTDIYTFVGACGRPSDW